MNIRPVSPNDADYIARIYQPIVSDTAISFESCPPGESEIRSRIEATVAGYPWYVAETDERAIAGYAYASQHRSREAYKWSVEVSAYVDPKYQRRGLAKKLYYTLFSELKNRGFANAYAGITLPNSASVGLHESLGFQKIGVYENIGFKMERWHDVGWWGLRLQSPDYTPVDAAEKN